MDVFSIAAVRFVDATYLFTWILAILVALVLSHRLSWSVWPERTTQHHHVDDEPSSVQVESQTAARQHKIPFVVSEEPRWRDLGRAIDQYHEEISNILNGLSRSLEIARMSEWDVFGHDGVLSESLQQRLIRISPLLDHDEKVLQKFLLKPFPAQKVLPHEELVAHNHRMPRRPSSNQPPVRSTKVETETSSYDSATQAVTHIVRDWSQVGAEVRSMTYTWCRLQLEAAATTVLLPGAGLGRLAYELARDGHAVEANDSSLVMASAAHSILQNRTSGILHPFLMDFFVNEVDSTNRYRGVSFPDVDMTLPLPGTLSYTVGDFVETYGQSQSSRKFGAVVTCFFLDTATNVYEYMSVISNVLCTDGIWVNLGPLQWHRNATLHPSADELKRMIEAMGFDVTHWSIDQTPMNYRLDEDVSVRSTKYEAYRPLRMVAIRRSQESSFLNKLLLQTNKAQKHPPSFTRQSEPESTVRIEEL